MEKTLEIPAIYQTLYQPNRYKVFWGGRGAAKSWNCAISLLVQATQRPLRVLCTREVQGSIRESVHKLLADQIDRLGLRSHYEVVEHTIRGKNGSEFIFEGLRHNVDKIKSTEGIDIVWIEEADRVSDDSWQVLIPTIRKPGSEIWVTFNPKNRSDATYQRFVEHPPEGAIVEKVSWRDNPWFSEELHAEMAHLKELDYEEFLHVWEGEFKSFASSAIYQKQLKQAREEGRICRVPIEPSCEVHTAWDLGKNDTTAIWFFQKVGVEYRFIDYVENRLVDIDYYAKAVRSKDYLYGTHYLPHDVEFELLGMINNRKKQLEDSGIKPIEVVPRIRHIQEGIEMTRRMFASCWFDQERCEQGIEALANYEYQFDAKNNTHRSTPLHNWASNGADAFRQVAQGFKQSSWSRINDQQMSERRRKIIGNQWGGDTAWRT